MNSVEKEFEEAGTIRVPTEPVNPRESDDEKEKETLVKKSTIPPLSLDQM